jgi:hypothetical protein
MHASSAVRHATLLVGMTVVLGAGLAAGPALAQETPFRWTGTLAAGQVIEVKGIMGSVVAEPAAAGGPAEVVAEKRGRPTDFSEVEIRVVEASDGVTICAVYNPEDYVGDDCDLDDRRRDRNGDRGRDTRVDVDFTVRVPEGVELIAGVVTGDVEAHGLRSNVVAHSVSGDVAVSTTGVIEAGTVSGSLDLAMGSLDWTRLDFNTVSGDITLRVPEGLGAEVDFESISGDLDTDFDMRVERRDDRLVGSRVEGTIGDGDRRLSFHTVSGSVRLLRAR